jgi:hypothetical protein
LYKYLSSLIMGGQSIKRRRQLPIKEQGVSLRIGATSCNSFAKLLMT